eukprot:718120-Amorphochlora_amoeboformis.AAC.2
MELFPCAIFANGPACTIIGVYRHSQRRMFSLTTRARGKGRKRGRERERETERERKRERKKERTENE